MDTHKKLYRSKTNRILFGICSGLGQYFEIDPTVFRILFIIAIFFGGFGILLYIILLFIIPDEPIEGNSKNHEQIVREAAEEFKEKAEEFKNKTHAFASEMAEMRSKRYRHHSHTSRNLLGVAVIIFGIVLLLKEVVPFYFFWFNWSVAWAIILIVLGLYIISKRS